MMRDPAPLSQEYRSRIAETLSGPAPDWPMPPIVPGDWQLADDATALDILDIAGRHAVTGTLGQPVPVAHELCRVRMRSLSCYGDALLVEALALVPRIGLVSFIVHREGVTYLTGRSEPIHGLNALIPVDLSSAEKRSDYFQFFMNWVRGEKGRFQPLGVDTIPLHRNPEADSLARLQAVAGPPTFLADPETEGCWNISTQILYANAIFQAKLRLEPDGMIRMTDDVELSMDLALRPECVTGYLLFLDEHTFPSQGEDT